MRRIGPIGGFSERPEGRTPSVRGRIGGRRCLKEGLRELTDAYPVVAGIFTVGGDRVRKEAPRLVF